MSDQAPILKTARCVLRPVSATIAQWVLDGRLDDLRPAEGWPHNDTKAGLSHVFLEPPALVWLIETGDGTIGECGTHAAVDESGFVEIGFGLAAPSRGRGYGTECVSALTEWLVDHGGARRVFARTTAENIASRRVLEKAGFEQVASTGSELEFEYVAHENCNGSTQGGRD